MRGKRGGNLIDRLGVALVVLAVAVAGFHNFFSITSLRRRKKGC